MKRMIGQSACFKILALSLFVLCSFIGPKYSNSADSTVPTDFPTIQQAIDDPGTGTGDTITVLGNHAESNVHITKQVTIAGQGIGNTIIDGQGGTAFFVDTQNVTLRDMTIQDASQAVRFEMAGGTIFNTTFERVSFFSNSSRGIEVHNATTVRNLLITECNFESTTIGLRVSSSGHVDGVEFRDTTFTSNNIGIYEANDGGTSTLKNMLITGCTFTDHTQEHGSSGVAIYMEEVQDALIEGNHFMDNRRDIQILKWYQPSIPVSNVVIRDNTMSGTTDTVFSIFNAHHASGQTRFEGVSFTGNIADTDDASAVFAGAHSTTQNSDPSLGGIGWNTVFINCNDFTGITTTDRGTRFFVPDGIPDDEALAGAKLNVKSNYWGTKSTSEVKGLMEIPAITNFIPILRADISMVDSGFCVGEEPSVAIPTLSQWGYLLLALLFLGASIYYVRFRKSH